MVGEERGVGVTCVEAHVCIVGDGLCPGWCACTNMQHDESRCNAGTRVNAQTLLSSVESDHRKGKICNMVKTQEGRALLQGLVDTLTRKMASVITAANRIHKKSGPRVLGPETLIRDDGSSSEAWPGNSHGSSGADASPASTPAAVSSSIGAPDESKSVLDEHVLSGNPSSHLADKKEKDECETHEQVWNGFFSDVKPMPAGFDISAIFDT